MTPEQRKAFIDRGIIPDGWKWCPDCNGEGIIYVMDASPDMNEHHYTCHRCETDQGIVFND